MIVFKLTLHAITHLYTFKLTAQHDQTTALNANISYM